MAFQLRYTGDNVTAAGSDLTVRTNRISLPSLAGNSEISISVENEVEFRLE